MDYLFNVKERGNIIDAGINIYLCMGEYTHENNECFDFP